MEGGAVGAGALKRLAERAAAASWPQRILLTTVCVPASVIASPALGVAFTLATLGRRFARRGALDGLRAVANLPFDLLINTLGWLGALALYPCYAGGVEDPAVGRLDGSLVFLGGPIGQGISLFSAAFTPTSAIFVAGRSWGDLPDDDRDRLINHELWHARRQFGLYTGWVFWPAYLGANLVYGVHRRNPFESGRNGPYTQVDRRWGSGYRSSPEYVDATDPFWW